MECQATSGRGHSCGQGIQRLIISRRLVFSRSLVPKDQESAIVSYFFLHSTFINVDENIWDFVLVGNRSFQTDPDGQKTFGFTCSVGSSKNASKDFDFLLFVQRAHVGAEMDSLSLSVKVSYSSSLRSHARLA